MSSAPDYASVSSFNAKALATSNTSSRPAHIPANVGVRLLSELENGKETCHIGKVLIVLSNLGMTMIVNEDGEE